MATTNNYRDVYIQNCLDLAATIVIKSTDVATAINNYLIAFYGDDAVDASDPTTWRYYKNLSGEYHSADTVMQVVSMDTLETIDFTKDNLAVHRATAKAYQYGTREYRALVAQYPRQEMLIRGVLYPVDIDEAVAADDFAILGGWPDGLVEANEYSFIQRLQTWVSRWHLRWFNRAYTATHNLYLTSHLGILYALLPQAIISLRKEVSKTNEAHSFHMREYLESHGRLGKYFDQLTTKQAILLCRNMRYLERHPGQRQVFSWLIDNVLTPRQIPLAEYTMRHDTTAQPGEVYPVPVFDRTALNLGYNYDTLDQISLSQLLDKETPMARDNALYFETDVVTNPDGTTTTTLTEPDVEEALINSAGNVLQTKALDSTMIDYSGVAAYELDQTLLSHWLWLSYRNLYVAQVAVDNPRTGERIVLPAKEAYVLMMYAFCQSIGHALTDIPPFFAMHVQRIPNPSTQELMSIVDPAYVPYSTAVEMLSYLPVIQRLISIDAFYNQCMEICQAENTQDKLVAFQEHYVTRGYVDNMMNRCYADVMCDLFPGEQYTTWLAERNLDLSDFSIDDYGLLYASLVSAGTGQDLQTTNSVANIQASMLGILTQLSSYSIQITSKINSSEVVVLEYPMVRQGDWEAHIDDSVGLVDPGVELLDYQTHIGSEIVLPLFDSMFDETLTAGIEDSASETLPNLVMYGLNNTTTYYMRQQLALDVSYNEDVPADTEGIIPVLGISTYLALDADQRSHFKDVYGSHYANRPA